MGYTTEKANKLGGQVAHCDTPKSASIGGGEENKNDILK